MLIRWLYLHTRTWLRWSERSGRSGCNWSWFTASWRPGIEPFDGRCREGISIPNNSLSVSWWRRAWCDCMFGSAWQESGNLEARICRRFVLSLNKRVFYFKTGWFVHCSLVLWTFCHRPYTVHFINNGKQCLYRIYEFASATVVSMYTLPKRAKRLVPHRWQS